jgi:hypothetical protein
MIWHGAARRNREVVSEELTYRDLPPRLLLRVHNLPMVNDHGEAGEPPVRDPADRGPELDVWVGEEQLLNGPKSAQRSSSLPSLPAIRIEKTHNIIVLNPIRLAPSAHNPRVVHSHHGHDIHALGLEVAVVLDVAGEVAHAAAGGEGARDGEEDDFLGGPFFGGRVGLGDAAGGYGGGFGGVGDGSRGG